MWRKDDTVEPESAAGAPLGVRLILLLVGLGIGAITVVAFDLILSVVSGDDVQLTEGITFLGAMSVWVSVPFLCLAFIGVVNKVPWIVALALTFLIWGYMLADSIASLDSDGGANIGLGLILAISPAVISVVSVIVAWKSEQPKSE